MQLSKITQSDKNWRSDQYNEPRLKPRNNEHVLDFRDKKKKKKGKGGFKAWLWSIIKSKKFAVTLGTALAILVMAFVIGVGWISKDLPSPDTLIKRDIIQSTKIYDRTGQTVLYEISGDIRRSLVELNAIPNNLKNATIAIEDKNYYKHGGISYWAIFRTAVTNVLFRRHAGGSTLTQQFIKNAVLSNEKKLIRKIKEAVMAVQLEKRFSKDEILKMYLNEIPYGSTAYGVEAASQMYFGKDVQKVNLAEAAILAALPQSPSYYSPYGNHKDALIGRQRYVLDQMVEQGYIKQDEADAAKKEKLNFKKPASNIKAPHFVMYVKDQLEEKYGQKMVEEGGLKVYTTLDLTKQTAAEEIITKYGDKNVKYDASNAALLSVDPKTGEILSMVGSRDYFNDDIDGQVNLTTSLRQPGSSLKPFVYATAFIRGYTPNTVLYDVLTNFSTDPSKAYEPRDYDGKERGPISMRKSLAGSLNIPAVKTLYLAGINNVLDLVNDLGYTTLKDRDRYGLSIVLGGGEVKMVEHVNAYSAFANGGKVHSVISIMKVTDKDGKVIDDWTKDNKEKKVFDANIANMVSDVLSDNNARSYIFGTRNNLTLPDRPVAAKTGTTNDYRDAWTIGYTPSVVTGVWVGNNNNTPMKKGSAAAVIAVPIWHDYMEKILKGTPVESFTKPNIDITGKSVLDGVDVGIQKVNIDKVSGLLATSSTPPDMIEQKSFMDPHCILYYVDKSDPRGAYPTDPASDPQFVLWESRVKAWADKQNISTSTPPTDKDNVHLAENAPQLKIVSPTENESIANQFLSVKIETTAPRGVNRAEYYLDDNLVATVKSFPFNLDKAIDFLSSGFHGLKVRVCDDVDNCSEQKLNFKLDIGSSIVNDSFGISMENQDMTVYNKDFPLPLSFRLNNLRNIVKVQVLYSDLNGNLSVIGNIPLADSEAINFSWKNIPLSGTYRVYAKAFGWNNKTALSEKITVIVKNSNKTASSTETVKN